MLVSLLLAAVQSAPIAFSQQALKCIPTAITGFNQMLEIKLKCLAQTKAVGHLFASQGPRVKQFMDIFSIPEMTLLAVANHYFISNHIEYDPVHLFKDVSVRALTDSHCMERCFLFFWGGLPTWFPMLRSFPCWEAHCSIVLGFLIAGVWFQTSIACMFLDLFFKQLGDLMTMLLCIIYCSFAYYLCFLFTFSF